MKTTTTRHRRTVAVAVAGGVAASLTLAACSGDEGAETTATRAATTTKAAPTPSATPLTAEQIKAKVTHPTTIFGGKDNVFAQDITKAPVDKRSPAMIKNLQSQITPHWGGVAAFNAYTYNSSLFVADASSPKVRVTYVDCQKKGFTPPDFYGGTKIFVDVPIPKDAVPALGTDAALAIWDPTQDKFWEFWQAKKDAKGTWQACYGGRIDKVSTNKQAAFPPPYGTSASGLATSATVISVKEAQDLKIDHAIYLALMKNAVWNDIAWPANRSDGVDTSASRIPIGTRLRLDPTVDVESLPMSPLGKAVARAAQKHGFLVSETAGAVGVATMSGNVDKVRTGTNPWDAILADTPDYAVLKGFPWHKVQAIQRDWGKPAAAPRP